MKHFYCMVAFLLSVLAVSAKPITREQAQQRAVAFMREQHSTKALTPVTNVKKLAPRKFTQMASTVAPYYVFNKGENDGYVIVTGDDQIVDVLGYCDQGEFDYDQLPPNMREWLDDYAVRIERIQKSETPVVRASIPTHPSVAPMVTSKWSQGNPYNLTCPDYFGMGRSVTGCVATAMAQLLYYNREKSVTETQAAMPAYDTYTSHSTYGRLHVAGIPAGSPIDWDNMKDTYSSATDIQKKAVADLMHYCGVGAKMDYTNSSSGAQSHDAYLAIVNYFGYGSSVQYVAYNSVTSDVEWDRIVYAEMAAQRPIYISGANSDAGHAFVCDGYDGNMRYHINWGWGGQSDGYYYLTNLTPGDGQGIGGSASGYNSYREIIIGLEPENYGAKAMTISDAAARNICLNRWDADGDGKLTYGEAAAVTDLGDAFKNQKKLTNFSELYYFTGLTKLDDDAFNGCSALTTIRLPKALKEIGARAFNGCTKLNRIDLPDNVSVIGEEAFADCRALRDFILPEAVTVVEAGTFKNCVLITSMELPYGVNKLGDGAFAGCSKLTGFTVKTFHPEDMAMGAGVFSGIDLSAATLHVMQGMKPYFSQTDQWKDFGHISQTREVSGGTFANLEAGKKYYIFNAGMGRYLTKGEAYGTQAIVGSEPMRFVVNHLSSMPEGVYYLTSEDTGKDGKYLFRTSSDGNVGAGVKATFVDGSSLTTSAYWKIQQVADKFYTFQTPTDGTGFVEGQFLGVQTDHASNAASPTYGVYSDIDYASHAKSCQWQFVLYDENAVQQYKAAEKLGSLLELATKQHLDVEVEQVVYENLESTIEELTTAQKSVRRKLGFMEFANDAVREICVSHFDINRDGELSYTEASQATDFYGVYDFQSNKNITSFDELKYFSNITLLYGNTFEGCTNLESIVLPSSLEIMYYRVFYNCRKLKSISLPEYIMYIGDNNFTGCTALREVTVMNPDPSDIQLSDNAFSGLNLGQCTLYVPVGSKELYAAADTWKDFGQIVEVRGRAQPKFSPIVANQPGYVYNLGLRKYLNKGEAYGTQSVVAKDGMLYQFKRTSSMADSVYYLYSDYTGKDGKVLFRTSTDQKLGEGVKACFVDGTVSDKAYWKVDSVNPNVYTLHVPSTDANYVEGEYFGTLARQSIYYNITYGTYWYIPGGDKFSQWAFVTEADFKAANDLDDVADKLKDMLKKANDKQIDVADEQAVYDNLASTTEDMRMALVSVREKLHYITFADNGAQKICLNNWDTDFDGELTYEEAAAVTSIGEKFRNSNMTSFEELKYFTSLTDIPEKAFYGSASVEMIYIPASVKTIGMSAFSSCRSLRNVVLLGNEVLPYNLCGLMNQATVFVPGELVEAYKAVDDWASKTIVEYTGKPVVSAKAARAYGRTSGTISVLVTGAPVMGKPEIVCDAIKDATLAVGEYPITVMMGDITTLGVELRDGVLTIQPATLTVTAQSYTRKVGEPNPQFELTYKGWRNKETEDVLIAKPVATCTATVDSPAGDYEISISGGEAQNYEFVYVPGTLTIVNPDGISAPKYVTDQSQPVYDLQGRRVTPAKRGLYITRDRKVMLK